MGHDFSGLQLAQPGVQISPAWLPLPPANTGSCGRRDHIAVGTKPTKVAAAEGSVVLSFSFSALTVVCRNRCCTKINGLAGSSAVLAASHTAF